MESNDSKPDLNNSKQEDIDNERAEKFEELEKKVLSLVENANKIEHKEKREEFKKELTSIVLELENKMKTLLENDE